VSPAQRESGPNAMNASERKPRLFYGWVIVAGAWIMYMINQAAFTWGFTVFVDPLAETFQWRRTSITIAWALSLGWGLLLAPWFGRLFDRRGPRPVMLIGGILGGAGWAVMPLCTSYWAFLASLVLLVGTGINGAIGPSVGSAAIAQWFKLRRSLALGIYFTGSGGAGLVLIPMMSLLAEHSGWQASAWMLGATTLLLTLLVVPFMRFKPEQHGLLVDGGDLAGGLAAPRPWDFIKRLPLPKHRVVASHEFTLAQALRTSAFWLFTAAVFLRYFGMGIAQVHQMPHMLAEGVDPLVATAALSLALTINIPSRVAVGWMGDVYDKKWLLNLLAVAGGFALLAFALLRPGQTAWVWVYAVLWGIGLAMLPLQAAWVADTFGRNHYGSINSMTNSLALSGRIVGALAAAVAYDVFDSYTHIMLLGAIGFGVGALVLVILPSPRMPVP
jgi:MFS family permease